jgi:hypothetical protein
VEGLTNAFAQREVAQKQASHLVGINFQDAAPATYRFEHISFIEALFNHMADSMEPDPISPCAHEHPDLLQYALFGLHVEVA